MALRVLIADDNKINREFLFGVLAGEDYQIEQAVDGKTAIECCREQRFDLILMDIRMPGIDGIQATTRIRELPGYEATPVIALTADLGRERQDELLRSGFDATLAKPVSRQTLLTTLESLSEEGSAPAAEETDHQPPIDRQAALAAAGGNAQLVDRLTGMLVRELDRFCPAIDEALNDDDAGQAREMAHKLRASAGYCGARAVQAAAAELEETLKSGEDAAPAVERLQHASESLKAYLGRSA